MGVFEALTATAAWLGFALGGVALAVALRSARPKRPAPAVLRATLSGARHARHGTDSTLAALVEVENRGSEAARVHLVQAELEVFRSGEHGLRTERARSEIPLGLSLLPGTAERLPVSFEFKDALVPDGDVSVRVRVVAERGFAETTAVSRA